jgi:hypothetical protein
MIPSEGAKNASTATCEKKYTIYPTSPQCLTVFRNGPALLGKISIRKLALLRDFLQDVGDWPVGLIWKNWRGDSLK